MEVLPLCLILIGVRQKAGTLLEVKIAAAEGSRAEGDELRGGLQFTASSYVYSYALWIASN